MSLQKEKKRKRVLAKMLMQIIFSEIQSISCSKAINVSKTWTNTWNKMVEEKAGVERQNSKKGFEKNEHACSVERVLWF